MIVCIVRVGVELGGLKVWWRNSSREKKRE